MVYDYSKLLGKIKEKYRTQENFAKALEIGKVTLSHKLNSKQQFSQNEIRKSVNLLDIDKKEIPEYFFKLKV